MKRIIMAMLALVMLAPMATVVNADNSKYTQKALEKSYKDKVKQLKKGGWEILGTRTLEVAVGKHYDRCEELDRDAVEYTGTAVAKTKNAAVQKAQNDAVIKYAQQSSQKVQAKILSELKVDEADVDNFTDTFNSMFTRQLETTIKDELEPSFTVVRTTKDGMYECEAYYIVNENQARKARMKAAEAAITQAGLNAKYIDQVSKIAETIVID